jgi:dsRNA-specific ribonuclease
MDNLNNRLVTKLEVENILNYFENIGDDGQRLVINNLEHYQQAFIHESYYQAVQYFFTKNENKNENTDDKSGLFYYVPKESSERLEYLGDHILKAVMGRYLFERFGNEREGFLTRLKIKIEKCSMLHKIGVTLGFKKFLLLSLQVENQTILDIDRGRNTPSYYEDAFEAFIGSILLDFGERGYLYADRFVRSVIENIIDFAELISKNDNFKDSLQRYFQSLKWKTPIYSSLNEEGPLYRKVFTRMLTINSDQYELLDKTVQNMIKIYSSKILEEYRVKNPQIYTKLITIYQKNDYIIGIGFGRKVTSAEQECAKTCLLNLQLDLNF